MPAHQHSVDIEKRWGIPMRGSGHEQKRKLKNMPRLSEETRDELEEKLEKLRQELKTDDRKPQA